LAPQVPPVFASPIYKSGMTKLDEAVTRAGIYYDANGEKGLREKVQTELDRAEKYLTTWAERHSKLAATH
jgi:hypothetical protein